LRCFDGNQGVEPQTETVWRQADQATTFRASCFVNKMDKIGADFQIAQSQTIRERLGVEGRSPIQLPIGAESSLDGVVDLVA
jgi:elongation factor G